MSTQDTGSLSPVFIGFRAKRVAKTPDWLRAAAGAAVKVEEICSISDCISEPPPDWVNRWDFNPACCYNSEAAAVATVPIGDVDSYELFAYRMFPVRYGIDGPQGVDLHLEWGGRKEEFPVEQDLGRYVEIGYDVAGGGVTMGSQHILGFGCSPLSCNGLAAEYNVNRCCLLESFQEAAAAAALFAQPNEAEPGPYYVYQVLRRRSAVWNPDQPAL